MLQSSDINFAVPSPQKKFFRKSLPDRKKSFFFQKIFLDLIILIIITKISHNP